MSRLELGLDAFADLRELDHRHPDRVARDVAEVVAAVVKPFETARWTSCAVAPGPQRRLRGLEVLLVGLEHPRDLVARRAERARDLDPVAARAGDLERRDAEVAERRCRRGRARTPARRAPCSSSGGRSPRSTKSRSAGASTSAAVLARRVGLAEGVEALGVDANAVAHRLELRVALDGARVVELDDPTGRARPRSRMAAKSRTVMT